MVLDVEKFIDQHPGGRFSIQHNVGRDISKFFYGGYSLENNIGGPPAKGYAHSTFAKIIVCDLAIARYEHHTVKSTLCRVVEELSRNVNATTKTIIFENILGDKVHNWRKYYTDIDSIGKHFRVRNMAGTDKDCVWRHYTICNSMQPDYYQGLVRALKD